MTTAIDPVPLAPTGRPWIFYTPHQDDETLWAGQIIAHHALVGRDVHIVSVTDGSTSVIRRTLNGEEPNGWWGGMHYPRREGIWIAPDYQPLTPGQFAGRRDNEMINACAHLGVPVENIHIGWTSTLNGEPFTRTSTISELQARQLIRDQEAQHPGAGHYTMWWGDTDTNHANLGKALRWLAINEADTFKDCRYVVRRSQAGTASGVYKYMISDVEDAANALHMAKCAAKAYESFVPPHYLAVAPQSVAGDIDAVKRGEPNWYVKQP